MSKFPTASEMHQKALSVIAKRIKDKVDEYIDEIIYGLTYASNAGSFSLSLHLTSNEHGSDVLDHVIYNLPIIEQNAILARLLNELTVSGYGYEVLDDFEDDKRTSTSMIIKW